MSQLEGKFTPGPWHVSRRRDGLAINEAQAYLPFGEEANASLIASAPELLEALKDTLGILERMTGASPIQARQAIAAKEALKIPRKRKER